MSLVSTGPIGRQRNERDKENLPVGNFNSYRAPGREKPFEDHDKIGVHQRKENGRNFDKNYSKIQPEDLNQEMAKDKWREQPSFDSEVIRNQGR